MPAELRTSSSQPAFRRRRYLINRPFQIRVIGFVMATVAVLVAAFYALVHYYFSLSEELGLATGLPADHVYYQRLRENNSDLATTFLAVSAIMLLLTFSASLLFSHRVAGPVYRMTTDLATFDDASLVRPIRFREGDFFPELAEAFNKRLAHLRRLARERPEKLAVVFSGELPIPKLKTDG